MLKKKEFLTIYSTFNNNDVVAQILPGIISETKLNDAALIVWDSSPTNNNKKRALLNELNKKNDFFLIYSSNASVGDIRNTCLHLGQQLFAPDYICILDDDHGYKPGFIKSMTGAIKKYYGKKSENGLLYGLFTGCNVHRNGKRNILPDGHSYPDKENEPGTLGGTNGCCRCSTTSHWNNILKGYDSDEYLISLFQTGQVNMRNYRAGFTTLIVDNGLKSINIEHSGRGTSKDGLKLWDDKYTASDSRAKYLK